MLAGKLMRSAPDYAQTQAVKLLSCIVRRVSVREAKWLLGDVGELLRDCFGDASADLRKNVVFCIVEFYAKVDTQTAEEYLRTLTKSQEKLARIYIKRREERAFLM